jgi:hypothetical protein
MVGSFTKRDEDENGRRILKAIVFKLMQKVI